MEHLQAEGRHLRHGQHSQLRGGGEGGGGEASVQDDLPHGQWLAVDRVRGREGNSGGCHRKGQSSDRNEADRGQEIEEGIPHQ